MLRLLWRTRGAYSIKIIFDPAYDAHEFGWNLSSNFNANLKFNINEQGQWIADFNYSFVQSDNAWVYNDFSTATSVAASRARKLAVKGSDGSVVYDDVERDRTLAILEERKQSNLSFDYQYNNRGQW